MLMADGAHAAVSRWPPRHLSKRAHASPDLDPDIEPPSSEFAAHVELVELLVRRRHAIGWTQAEVNYRANFEENYISHCERPNSPHGRVPGPVFMRRWCAVLGVQPILTVTKTIAEVLEADPLPPVGPRRKVLTPGDIRVVARC
jgi:transcriptional regulator with XRE-family HTH domain